MSLIPRSSVIPPGGWHFVDCSTAEPFRIDGTDEQDVAQRVLKYRLDNKLPPGNPVEELRQFICGTWPHFCHNTEPHPVGPSSGPLSRKVAAWMASFYTNFPSSHSVDQLTAEHRAAVCSQCPHNVDYTRGGCTSCLEAVRRLSFVWRRNRTTSQDAKLQACGILAQHNATAAWARKLPEISTEQKAQLPPLCWRRGET